MVWQLKKITHARTISTKTFEICLKLRILVFILFPKKLFSVQGHQTKIISIICWCEHIVYLYRHNLFQCQIDYIFSFSMILIPYQIIKS